MWLLSARLPHDKCRRPSASCAALRPGSAILFGHTCVAMSVLLQERFQSATSGVSWSNLSQCAVKRLCSAVWSCFQSFSRHGQRWAKKQQFLQVVLLPSALVQVMRGEHDNYLGRRDIRQRAAATEFQQTLSCYIGSTSCKGMVRCHASGLGSGRLC